MYIHIGGNSALDEDDILFMIPKQTAKASYDTRRCIDTAIGSGRVNRVADGAEDTYIICDKGRLMVYSSPISSTALIRRVK